jgi:hypothetical protein
LTRLRRSVGLVALAALVTVSCTKLGSTGTNPQPADIYAAGPSVSVVQGLFGGDTNWWQGPPSFEVRPLDAATVPFTERFSITQNFLHLGTAEQLVVRYTVYDKTSSATTRMTDLQNALGLSPTNPKVGDQVLYYGLGGTGAAPYITRTFVRVGQIVVQVIWSRKDGIPTVAQLGKNAAKFVEGLKKVLAGKVQASPQAVNPKYLPTPGLDITYLGSAQLPIEAWLVMDGLALPAAALAVLHGEGTSNFVFGDFVLNNDTHMEVRTALLPFPSATAATDWASTFAPATPDQAGVASAYIPVGGSPASGEYHYFFTSGAYGGMLICKPSLDGEAASRECEAPMERTAIAWKLTLSGLS